MKIALSVALALSWACVVPGLVGYHNAFGAGASLPAEVESEGTPLRAVEHVKVFNSASHVDCHRLGVDRLIQNVVQFTEFHNKGLVHVGADNTVGLLFSKIDAGRCRERQYSGIELTTNIPRWRLATVRKDDVYMRPLSDAKIKDFGFAGQKIGSKFLAGVPLLLFDGFYGIGIGSNGGIGRAPVEADGLPNKIDAGYTQQYGYDSRRSDDQSPDRHLPLGIKIGIVLFLLLGGLLSIGNAFRRIDVMNPGTALGYIGVGVCLYVASIFLAFIPVL